MCFRKGLQSIKSLEQECVMTCPLLSLILTVIIIILIIIIIIITIYVHTNRADNFISLNWKLGLSENINSPLDDFSF